MSEEENPDEIDIVEMIKEFFLEQKCECSPVKEVENFGQPKIRTFDVTGVYGRKYRVHVDELTVRVNLLGAYNNHESSIIKVILSHPDSLDQLKQKAVLLATMRNGPALPGGVTLPDIGFGWDGIKE